MFSSIDSFAQIDPTAMIGDNTQIWAFSQLRENVRVGKNCIIGRGVYVGSGVFIGDNCKIQNSALIYESSVISDGVFIGPGVIFTNDQNPRAITCGGNLKLESDWTPVGVEVLYGASIGAGAICIAPVKIGRWAMIASGAVVTRDVPNHALMAGIPARQIGWVGASGFTLIKVGDLYVCPETRQTYEIKDEKLEEIV